MYAYIAILYVILNVNISCKTIIDIHTYSTQRIISVVCSCVLGVDVWMCGCVDVWMYNIVHPLFSRRSRVVVGVDVWRYHGVHLVFPRQSLVVGVDVWRYHGVHLVFPCQSLVVGVDVWRYHGIHPVFPRRPRVPFEEPVHVG